MAKQNQKDSNETEPLVGISGYMDELREKIEFAASKDNLDIFIEGPSGTGKDLIAKNTHYKSDRKNGPFIPINCAAIPEYLFESEIFGHKQGAFTGATCH